MVNGTTTGGSACCKLDRECGRDQLDALAVDTLKSWLGTLTSGSDSARAERHDAEIEGLKREIEKGRRSGSPRTCGGSLRPP